LLFLNPEKDNKKSISCIWLSFDLSTLHFIITCCILFRSFRLISVFDFKYKLDYNKYKLREEFYLKVKLNLPIYLESKIISYLNLILKILGLIFLILLSVLITSYFLNLTEVTLLKDFIFCGSPDDILSNPVFKIIWYAFHILEIIFLFYSLLRLR
jgi:hypothetical protein